MTRAYQPLALSDAILVNAIALLPGRVSATPTSTSETPRRITVLLPGSWRKRPEVCSHGTVPAGGVLVGVFDATGVLVGVFDATNVFVGVFDATGVLVGVFVGTGVFVEVG